MTDLHRLDALAMSPTAFLFEGHAHGEPLVDASLFVTTSPPGRGPGLHVHPYPELFLVEDGPVRFRIGEDALDVTAGHVLVVPAGTQHGFTNTGSSPSRVLSVHPRGAVEQTWLEGEPEG